jgi:hypothetical protein
MTGRWRNIGKEAARLEIILLIDCMLFQTRRLFPSIIPKRPVILNEADVGGEVKNLHHLLQPSKKSLDERNNLCLEADEGGVVRNLPNNK